MNINNLSIQEKIAQKMMLGVYSSNIDIIINLIKQYQIGGVILYKRNYKNYDEMISVIKRIKEANKDNKIPLFIAIDQEGGIVNRLPSEFHVIKNNYNLSKHGADLIYKNGHITGRVLNSLGINMNFAPVLDINENNTSGVLYNRCFYGKIDNIINCAMRYIDAMNENNVIPVVKHFPGHGVTKGDSHLLPPYVYNYKKILDNHIKPFEYVIKNNSVSVMVGHLVVRELTGGVPASISSKFIKNYIREKYNFDGLVITDEISMLSRSLIYNFNLVKNVMFSCGDIVLMKLDNKYNNFIEKCVKYVEQNSECLSILDDSVNRIINMKRKYQVNDDYENLGCNISVINEEIDKLNNFK